MIQALLGTAGFVAGKVGTEAAGAVATNWTPAFLKDWMPETAELVAELAANLLVAGVWLVVRPGLATAPRTGVDIALFISNANAASRVVNKATNAQTTGAFLPTFSSLIDSTSYAVRSAILGYEEADRRPY